MRIIGGSARGRKLKAPRGPGTRPTADRVRQSIFDVLGQRCDGEVVLDLYAGTGAFGLEALSRGAARAVLVERDREAAEACAENAAALGFAPVVEVVRSDIDAALRRLAAAGRRFTLVFVDPPYAQGPEAALEGLGVAPESGTSVLAPGARVVAEHDRRRPPPERVGALRRNDLRTFGEPAVSFFVLG